MLSVYNWLNPAPACTAPTASFTPTSASGAAPLAVNFADTSVANSGTLTTWVWTFGDGNTSSSQNPSDTYATPGTYTASLSVTNSCGDGSASPATATIYVSNAYAWWATNVYGLTGTLTGGNASYTGDGMSNTNKFMAGFNPTSAAAYLHVISVAKAVVSGQTNVTVTYLGANGDSRRGHWVADEHTGILHRFGQREFQWHIPARASRWRNQHPQRWKWFWVPNQHDRLERDSH